MPVGPVEPRNGLHDRRNASSRRLRLLEGTGHHRAADLAESGEGSVEIERCEERSHADNDCYPNVVIFLQNRLNCPVPACANKYSIAETNPAIIPSAVSMKMRRPVMMGPLPRLRKVFILAPNKPAAMTVANSKGRLNSCHQQGSDEAPPAAPQTASLLAAPRMEGRVIRSRRQKTLWQTLSSTGC